MKRKCGWCGAMNEPERNVCRACGIPFRSEPSPSNAVPAGGARPGGKWRVLFLVLVLAPVLAGLAIGGRFLWQRYSQGREALEQQAAAEGQRLAEAVSQREAKAARQRGAEAERQRVEAQQKRIPEVLAAAKDQLRLGNFASGLAKVNELLREVDSPELRETKVDLLNNMGRLNEAYVELLTLLKQRPDELYLQLAAVNFARSLNQPKAAISHVEAATRLAPSNTTYQISLANLCVEGGRAEDGFALFERLIADDPYCIDCWYNYGNALFNVGQFERAVGGFRNAVERFPMSDQHRLHLAVALDAWGGKSGDKSLQLEAATHYRKSLELHPMSHSVAAERIFAITGQRVAPELEAMSSEEVELQPAGNLNIVRVTINGVEGRFLLDSGASYTCVYRQAANRYKLAPSRRVMEREVKTANGKIQVPVAYGAVQVGQQKQMDALILLLPEAEKDGTDGLLGGDFLNTFNGQINFDHRRLILRGSGAKG